MNIDLLFSFDPGSVRTGWAILQPPEQLIKAGLILPDKQKDRSEIRIGDVCRGVWDLLNFWLPGTIVLEWTSGKTGRRHGTGGGAGLAVHGAATGALWQVAESWRRSMSAEKKSQTEIVLVKENDWTRGVPKADRMAAIAALYPEYRPADDSGGDIADAIGLALWWLREHRMRLAEAAGI